MKKKNTILPLVISLGAAFAATGLVVLAKHYIDKKNEEEAEPVFEEEPAEQGDEDEEELDDEVEVQEDDTLEAYIEEHPEEEESLKAVTDSFTADGVKTEISCTGNTMFFDFIMDDVEDSETAASLKPDLESFLEEQSKSYADIVKTIEEETGIDGIKMIVIFMDANEEEIVSGHYDEGGKVL